MNISSVVLNVKNEHKDEVIESIKNIENCEFATSGDGKVIVVIEAIDLDNELRAYRRLEELPKIMSASMVYSYQELDEDIAKINRNGDISEIILNDEIDAKDVLYYGSVNHKAK